MKFVRVALFFSMLSLASLHAEVAPATVRLPEAKAWTGQKLSLMVELRARGSFAGSASFSLPQLPGTVLMKIGGAVVSSEEIEGESWFVQSHEFVLFSQRTGPLEIPAFPVRFGARDGFTGPVKDVTATVPATRVEIQRPPGTDGIGFLITAESFDVKETWDPAPASCEVGAIFKRSIVQQADNMTGMALVPAPLTAPDGIRIYPPQVETSDHTDRGTFKGERRETLTYLIEKPGSITLPEIRYAWWNPKAQRLENKTLPAVVFEVKAPPPSPAVHAAETRRTLLRIGLGLIAILTIGWWQRARCQAAFHRIHDWWHDPERRSAKRLKNAANANDASAAYAALQDWLNTCRSKKISTTLQSSAHQSFSTECRTLESFLYAESAGTTWNGAAFAKAFATIRRSLHSQTRAPLSPSPLPLLNP